jgi:hypothetical protein
VPGGRIHQDEPPPASLVDLEDVAGDVIEQFVRDEDARSWRHRRRDLPGIAVHPLDPVRQSGGTRSDVDGAPGELFGDVRIEGRTHLLQQHAGGRTSIRDGGRPVPLDQGSEARGHEGSKSGRQCRAPRDGGGEVFVRSLALIEAGRPDSGPLPGDRPGERVIRHGASR